MEKTELLNALKWRYAVKKFDDSKKVDGALVESILESANLTATSLGLQAYNIILLEGNAWKDKLKPLTFAQESIQTCSHLLVLAARTDVNDEYIDTYVAYMEEVRGLDKGALNEYAKVCKGFVNQKSESEIDDWLAHQTYIVLGNLMTTCALYGVDSCPMEGFSPDGLDKLLELDKHNLKSAVLLPIGYRAEDDFLANQKKVRRPIDEMVIRL